MVLLQGRTSVKRLFLLLALSHSNASVSLPQTIANPDWDFLAMTLAIVISLCLLAFASGRMIASLLKTDLAQQAALMFGLGMNNNGAGQVLASMTLTAHPRVMLPIIFYNLAQHLVAGGVDFVIFRKGRPQEERPAQDAWGRRRATWCNLGRSKLALSPI
jgi:BASS family bile acid:Na+ symporter